MKFSTFRTGSQYPGEMVWPLSGALEEHFAIPGPWPSKANTYGLKEGASLEILHLGSLFSLGSCMHGKDVHAP